MILRPAHLRFAAIALLGGWLAACGGSADKPVQKPDILTLEALQSGGRFVLMQGEEVRIRLPANPGTGYRWIMLNEAPGTEALALAEEPSYQADGAKPGQGGTELWHFRAIGTGPTILYFVYRRAADPNAPAAREVIYSFEIR
jgi:inhibitor of cysteine peptidase